MCGIDDKHSDIDLFVPKSECRSLLLKMGGVDGDDWKKGETIDPISITRTIRAITIYSRIGRAWDKTWQTSQVILCDFRSVSEVLFSFDIGACQCAYFAGRFWATPECLFELLTHTILCRKSRVSINYDKRLSKYALNKGFSLLIQDFIPELIDPKLAEKQEGVSYILRAILDRNNEYGSMYENSSDPSDICVAAGRVLHGWIPDRIYGLGDDCSDFDDVL